MHYHDDDFSFTTIKSIYNKVIHMIPFLVSWRVFVFVSWELNMAWYLIHRTEAQNHMHFVFIIFIFRYLIIPKSLIPCYPLLLPVLSSRAPVYWSICRLSPEWRATRFILWVPPSAYPYVCLQCYVCFILFHVYSLSLQSSSATLRWSTATANVY